MGPCWLKLTGLAPVGLALKKSWCRREYICDNMGNLEVMEKQPDTPMLSLLSLSVKTVMNHKKHANEVVVVSGIIHKNSTKTQTI